MVPNVAQVSMAISGSLCTTATSAMHAVDPSANRIAVMRVGQRTAQSKEPAAAPTAEVTAQVTATGPFGPVGVQIVASATRASPPAMTETVIRVRVSMPRAARCALSRL